MEELELHVLSVGFGDCIVVRLPNGRAMLIDCRDAEAALSCLSSLQVSELEIVAATHAHRDHTIGLKEVMEAVPTRKFWYNEFPHPTTLYGDLLRYVADHSEMRWLAPRAGTILREGELVVQILSPPANLLRGTQADVNNSSIVLKLTFGNSFTAILGGDAQFHSWAYQMLNHRCELRSCFLKVSHHGSDRGCNLEVLENMRPRVAVVSVGPNRWGLPDDFALQVLYRTCQEVYRTDSDGTIVVTASKKGYEIHKE